ncbi:MAG: UDP-glucose 4-epimerase GalE [Oscillospiraceae bacterium]|nr:UDP-glucose 4-epimerase GalE [Oscillospiraceae bacterium]
MKKILITGGAGYIGSHCARILADEGYEVVIIDNLVKGHIQAIKDFKHYIGNIGDEDLVAKILSENKIDGVMHFAAYSLVGESMKMPYEYYSNNVGQTMSFLHSLIKQGVNNIVFSSTAAVYGQSDVSPITEEVVLAPINTYGETKLTVEKMLKWFNIAYGLNYTSLRYFNVAGAYETGEIGEDHNPETHLIPVVLNVALRKSDKLKIFGGDYPTPDGTCIRDYIHVVDLIYAHIKAYEYMSAVNTSDIFNLGSGGGYSNLEILNTARKITNCEIPADVEPRRPGDPPILIAASKKAEDILNWKRKYDINDIIATAWKWKKSHPDGYK